MTSKTVNYTAEVTAEVVERYIAGEAVESIAAAVGKSVRSVVAKLSREGVYKAKAEKAKAEKGVTKASLIEAIAKEVGVASEKLESLEKATKEALVIVAGALGAEVKASEAE